jgi:Flp pilus assembly protein CpaB
MKNMSVKRALLVAAVVACGVAGSVDWSRSDGLSFSVDAAQARVGRPLTPVSVAGVARRTTRRAVVGGAVVGGAAAACVRVLVNGRYVCRY